MGVGKKWNEYVIRERKIQLFRRAKPYLDKNKMVEFCKFLNTELHSKSNIADKVVRNLAVLGGGVYYPYKSVALDIAKKYWNGKVKENER